MAIARHDPRLDNHSDQVSFSEPDRPYKDTPATQLADVLESQYGLKPLDETIVFELLNRALEAEGVYDSPPSA